MCISPALMAGEKGGCVCVCVCSGGGGVKQAKHPLGLFFPKSKFF